MQKMKMNSNSKLLLGLCLLLLSDKALCLYLSTNDRDQMLKELIPTIDRVYNEKLYCPPNDGDQVKKCMKEENQKVNDICDFIKAVGDCNKVGLHQCEDGSDLWRRLASRLNKIGKSQGCSKIFEVDPTFYDTNSYYVVLGIILVAIVCLVIVIIVRIKRSKKDTLLLENPA